MNTQKKIKIQLQINEFARKIADTYIKLEVLCDSGVMPELAPRLSAELDNYYHFSSELEKKLPKQIIYTPSQTRVLQDLNKKREDLIKRELRAEYISKDFAEADKIGYELLEATLEVENMDAGFIKLFFSKL